MSAEKQATETDRVEWVLALALARYSYGDETWAGLDPEERGAIAEPYLRRAREIAPMVAAGLSSSSGVRP